MTLLAEPSNPPPSSPAALPATATPSPPLLERYQSLIYAIATTPPATSPLRRPLAGHLRHHGNTSPTSTNPPASAPAPRHPPETSLTPPRLPPPPPHRLPRRQSRQPIDPPPPIRTLRHRHLKRRGSPPSAPRTHPPETYREPLHPLLSPAAILEQVAAALDLS